MGKNDVKNLFRLMMCKFYLTAISVVVDLWVEHKERRTRNLLISTNYIAQRGKCLICCVANKLKMQ